MEWRFCNLRFRSHIVLFEVGEWHTSHQQVLIGKTMNSLLRVRILCVESAGAPHRQWQLAGHYYQQDIRDLSPFPFPLLPWPVCQMLSRDLRELASYYQRTLLGLGDREPSYVWHLLCSWENGAAQLGGLFRGPQQGEGDLSEEVSAKK